jgi:hypothetical protein
MRARMAGDSRTFELDKDSRHLAAAPQHIVRPLQLRLGRTELAHRADQRNADGEAQACERARALRVAPQQRKSECAPDARLPAPPHAPAAAVLPLRGEDAACRSINRGTLHELGIGRADDVDDFDRKTSRGCACESRNGLCVEQRHRLRKLVTAPAHFIDLEIGRVEHAHCVPHCSARHFQRACERCPRMEISIREQAQQPERKGCHVRYRIAQRPSRFP